ncbi:unnamed protein product [Adineta steineri]|uniref:DUF7164 domain-containing protein n=1 Tax=Adineta steineri TaxID=433720 RepID=A0A815BG91_9BILA|nr:unnamed protein product [Adineta steineri]CAF4082078.1 unnamed protein product [Adineta steineri]
MALRVTRSVRLLAIFITIVVICLFITIYHHNESSSSTETNIINNINYSMMEIITNKTIIHTAVIVSLAKHASHIAEFHLLYDSWRFIQNFSPLSQQVIIDLIVFCEQPSCSQLPSSCLPLYYNKQYQLFATCYYEELSVKIVKEWSDYLYMTSIAFLLTKEYKETILKYHWILRVDQDAVLSPALLFGLLKKHPIKLHNIQFGAVGHGNAFTHERLKNISKKLGYKHAGIHHLCSTWLVHPNDSIEIARLTTIIGRHFLQKEYGPHVPGLETLPAIGEWPKWWRGVTSLYAAEIGINHLYFSSIGHQHESSAIDHPGFSTQSIWNAWHIHCLHNSAEFSKFNHRTKLSQFLDLEQSIRINKMSNITYTQNILKEVINEFHVIQKNNGQISGKITVRDYVTALAWQKTHAAIGAINLD